MYYNKREKYFVSEYFYKNKIGCVKVDVEMYNVYNAKPEEGGTGCTIVILKN